MQESRQSNAIGRRVVVTGLGVICPIGNSAAATWTAAVAGQSGIGPITRFDSTGFETRFAGEVKEFDPAAVLGRKDARRIDRYAQFALTAALEAVGQARLTMDREDTTRVGVLAGTGMGGMETIQHGAETLAEHGPTRLGPFFVPMMLPNMAAGNIAIAIGAKGPNFATVSACASAAHAIGEATLMIRRGLADVMVAGGGEAPITKLGVAGFNAMGALSTRNDNPAGASRPFDAGRDGFVLAEGGAMLVLEERERARRRDAPILAEVIGYATTDDANHMVQPSPGGEGAARAMTLALAEAGLDPRQIDYVNAHGTSTQLNEKLETLAIKRAFGEAAATLPVSSTKSMTGHLLGAAGGLEAALCILAMRHGHLPPTINQTQPDPACDLDHVPNVARAVRPKVVMSNSMGFGGHNVSLIFREP